MIREAEQILTDIRSSLAENSDSRARESGQRFFREEVRMYGMKSAVTEKIAGEYQKKISAFGKKEIFLMCDDLWMSGMMEESFIACYWSYRLKEKYEPEDFKIFEAWVKNYVSNWASCDTLCNHTIGSFIDLFPQFIEELKRWTGSDNRWVKRASAVSLIIPARQGRYLSHIIEIADSLLTDKDDMVQKGYGWLLKEAGKAHRDEVYGYVLKHRSDMPRTALRYAIEKMPPAMKAEAMKRI